MNVTLKPIKMINSASSDDGDSYEYDDAAANNMFSDSFDIEIGSLDYSHLRAAGESLVSTFGS